MRINLQKVLAVHGLWTRILSLTELYTGVSSNIYGIGPKRSHKKRPKVYEQQQIDNSGYSAIL